MADVNEGQTMATLPTHAPVSLHVAPLRRGGRLLIAVALSWVVYLAIVLTVGARYEADLQAAAKAEGTTLAMIPAEEYARLAVQHRAYFVVTGLFLLVPSALLLAGLHGVRVGLAATSGARIARAAWWQGLGALLLWYSYNALNLGLLAGPDRLPPLVRDLDQLSVPLVSGSSVLGLVAVLCAGLALRRAGVARKTAFGVVVVAGLLLLLGAALVTGSGFTEVVPPPTLVPPALILGIGLVRLKGAMDVPARGT